jgi:hypothetical protein
MDPQLAHPLSFHHQPFLVPPGEQVLLQQHERRPCHRTGFLPLNQVLCQLGRPPRVHLDAGAHPDPAPCRLDETRADLPDPPQCRPEVRSCSRFRAFRPQRPRQRIPRSGRRLDREVPQHPLCLDRQEDRSAVDGELETSQDAHARPARADHGVADVHRPHGAKVSNPTVSAAYRRASQRGLTDRGRARTVAPEQTTGDAAGRAARQSRRSTPSTARGPPPAQAAEKREQRSTAPPGWLPLPAGGWLARARTVTSGFRPTAEHPTVVMT